VTQAAIDNAPRLRDAAYAEYLKVAGLRSVRCTTAVTVVLAIGVSILISKADAGRSNTSFDAVTSSLAGIIPAQLAIALLGSWTVTSEYTSGTIYSSLLAQPVRIRLLGAKLLVMTAATVVISLVLVGASFAFGQIALAPSGLSVGIGQPGVLRALFGAVAYLAGWGLLGFGSGALLRRTAPAVAAVVMLMFVLPVILSSVSFQAGRYAPSALGFEMFALVHSAVLPSLPVACSLFSVYVMAALVLGAARFIPGDA